MQGDLSKLDRFSLINQNLLQGKLDSNNKA